MRTCILSYMYYGRTRHHKCKILAYLCEYMCVFSCQTSGGTSYHRTGKEMVWNFQNYTLIKLFILSIRLDLQSRSAFNLLTRQHYSIAKTTFLRLDAEQSIKTYLVSEWINRCVDNVELRLKVLPHWEQEKVFSIEWTAL